MPSLPYMQFFPADYLRDTEILTLSAQGGWMRMLCSMWHPSRRGVLSLRLQAIARLLHASEQATKSIIMEIDQCGVADVEWGRHGGGINPDEGETVTITCRRVVRDWEKATAEKKTMSEGGKKGAARRWGNREANSPPIILPNAPPNDMPDTRSQIEEERERPLAKNSSAGIRRPTLDQAKSAAANFGIAPEKADEWWHAREASEWLKGMAGGGTAPVGANWQADLKTYALRGPQGNSAGASGTPPQKPQTKLEWE